MYIGQKDFVNRFNINVDPIGMSYSTEPFTLINLFWFLHIFAEDGIVNISTNNINGRRLFVEIQLHFRYASHILLRIPHAVFFDVSILLNYCRKRN